MSNFLSWRWSPPLKIRKPASQKDARAPDGTDGKPIPLFLEGVCSLPDSSFQGFRSLVLQLGILTAFFSSLQSVFNGCRNFAFKQPGSSKPTVEQHPPRSVWWSRGVLSGSFLQLSFVRTHSCNLNEQCAKPLKTQLRLSFYCRREKMQS